MHISHRHKFIFFSNPKTGSESIRKMLDPYSDIKGVPFRHTSEEHPFYSHISPAEVKAIFERRGWNYDEYFKFTFVRNPWARLVSLYQMIYPPPGSALSRLRKHMKRRLGLEPEFGNWLKSTRPCGTGGGGKPWERWKRYGTYSIFHYIADKEGNILVDQVIRLEDIDTEVMPLFERLGTPMKTKKIEKVNVRKYKPYTEYYTPELIELVRERYRYDIEHYHYMFGE